MSQLTTKEVLKLEFVKCANDPVYFIKKYCKIQHPTKGKIPFELYDFQVKCLEQFRNNDYNVILKSRQLGLSTLIAAYAAWMMLFKNDSNILVIAIDQKTSKNLVTKIRVMYDNLPKWMRVSPVEDNKLSLRLENGSQVVAVPATETAARSEALTLLIIDEAAFIRSAEEIWTAAQQTLSTGGSCIINSTPAGVGNFFHQTWVGAVSGENGFNPIMLPWQVHPNRSQEWYEKQCKVMNNDKRRIAQELECDFVSSGNTVLEPDILKHYRDSIQEPIVKRFTDGNLFIWKESESDKAYMVTADVSRGDSSDFSTFHIIDIDSMEQVGEYRGKLDTKTFGNLLVSIATEYNDALLVVENSTVGWATIQQIINRGYPNLYYSYKDEGYVDEMKQLNHGYDLRSKDKMVAGFTTSVRTRPLIIEKLCEYYRDKSITVYSSRLSAELDTFIWINGKPQAMNGYNDDLVMSMAMACWVRDSAIRIRRQGMVATRAALDATKKMGIYKPTPKTNNAGWSMKLGDGKQEDLTWLIGKPTK